MNVGIDLFNSSLEERHFCHNKDGRRRLGVDGSEEGSELSRNPARAAVLVSGPLPLFPPWRGASWNWRRVSRSRPVSFGRAAGSSFSLKHSSSVG